MATYISLLWVAAVLLWWRRAVAILLLLSVIWFSKSGLGDNRLGRTKRTGTVVVVAVVHRSRVVHIVEAEERHIHGSRGTAALDTTCWAAARQRGRRSKCEKSDVDWE